MLPLAGRCDSSQKLTFFTRLLILLSGSRVELESVIAISASGKQSAYAPIELKSRTGVSDKPQENVRHERNGERSGRDTRSRGRSTELICVPFCRTRSSSSPSSSIGDTKTSFMTCQSAKVDQTLPVSRLCRLLAWARQCHRC
jgi:hypothetical protein